MEPKVRLESGGLGTLQRGRGAQGGARCPRRRCKWPPSLCVRRERRGSLHNRHGHPGLPLLPGSSRRRCSLAAGSLTGVAGDLPKGCLHVKNSKPNRVKGAKGKTARNSSPASAVVSREPGKLGAGGKLSRVRSLPVNLQQNLRPKQLNWEWTANKKPTIRALKDGFKTNDKGLVCSERIMPKARSPQALLCSQASKSPDFPQESKAM